MKTEALTTEERFAECPDLQMTFGDTLMPMMTVWADRRWVSLGDEADLTVAQARQLRDWLIAALPPEPAPAATAERNAARLELADQLERVAINVIADDAEVTIIGRAVAWLREPPSAALIDSDSWSEGHKDGYEEARQRFSAEPRASQAAQDVLAERARQINAEGWTPEHDDQHITGAMAKAAASYTLRSFGFNDMAHDFWPWDDAWWKPKDQRRDLVRAAALLVAEIERLDRAVLTKEGGR